MRQPMLAECFLELWGDFLHILKEEKSVKFFLDNITFIKVFRC